MADEEGKAIGEGFQNVTAAEDAMQSVMEKQAEEGTAAPAQFAQWQLPAGAEKSEPAAHIKPKGPMSHFQPAAGSESTIVGLAGLNQSQGGGPVERKWSEAVRRWGGTPRVLARTDESVSSSRPLAASRDTGQPDSRDETITPGCGPAKGSKARPALLREDQNEQKGACGNVDE